METIYLTYSELQEFLIRRYMIIEKKSLKISKTKNIRLEAQNFVVREKQILLFISQVESIEFPNSETFPQLRTLFGLPAGLLKSREENTELKYGKTALELSKTDNIYLTIRRALLFLIVWGTKNLEIEQVKQFVQNTLPSMTDKQLLLLNEIIDYLSQNSELPEVKPKQESLNDTRFDYQQIWLGKAIGRNLLNGNLMTVEQRKWFLSIFESNHDISTNPFDEVTTLIVAYQFVMKVYNDDRMTFTDLLNEINKTNYKNTHTKNEIILFGLIIIGLLQKIADNYFPVAGASKMFCNLEICAFDAAKFKTFKDVSITGFDEMCSAMLQPVENCVKYYQIKNPNIKSKKWWQYNSEEKGTYPEMLPVIMPKNVIDFLKEYDKVFSFKNFNHKSLIVTSDMNFYNSLLGADNILYYDGENLKGKVDCWNKEFPLITDNEDVVRDFGLFAKNIVLNKFILPELENNWIVITSDYKLPIQVEGLICKLIKKSKPQQVFVFNFETKLRNNPLDLSKQNEIFSENIFTTRNSKKTYKSEKTKGDFQAELELLFGFSNIRIVNKPADSSQWEMVNIGINMLQKTPLCTCSILETRMEGNKMQDYEIILRSFSDIIIYDDLQRYMYMNL